MWERTSEKQQGQKGMERGSVEKCLTVVMAQLIRSRSLTWGLQIERPTPKFDPTIMAFVSEHFETSKK